MPELVVEPEAVVESLEALHLEPYVILDFLFVEASLPTSKEHPETCAGVRLAPVPDVYAVVPLDRVPVYERMRTLQGRRDRLQVLVHLMRCSRPVHGAQLF